MCEERRDLEKAVKHYESVLKIDENHSEARELLHSCRQLMIFQTGPDEIKEEKRRKSMAVDSSDEENVGKGKMSSSPSLLKTSTDKLKALIKEDRERKPRSTKKEKRRGQSSSSERETKRQKQRKKKRRRTARNSSSSAGSRSDSDSSYSSSRSRSSSVERGRKSRRKKKGKDKKRSKKTKRSRKHSESARRREKYKPESSVEKEVLDKPRLETDMETKEGHRMTSGDSKDQMQHKEKDVPGSSRQEEPNEEDDSYHRSAAASFLPVSSFDFFSRSTAIPGLGSPPPSDAPQSQPSAMQQDLQKRFSLLRDSPSQKKDVWEGSQAAHRESLSAGRSPTDAARTYQNQSEMSWDSREAKNYQNRSESFGSESGQGRGVRQNEALIAQREKFYNDIKEADSSFRRFRSSSSRSSRSRSGSQERTSHGARGHSSPKKKGRSPRDHQSTINKSSKLRAQGGSPVVTGIRDLDRHLGGSKFLIQKAMEAKGFSSWEELTGKLKSDKMRSPSPKRFKSRSPVPERHGSKSPSSRRLRSGSGSPKKYKSRSPYPNRYPRNSLSPHATRKTSRSPKLQHSHSIHGQNSGPTKSRNKSPTKSPITYDWGVKLQSARMGRDLGETWEGEPKARNKGSESPQGLFRKREKQEDDAESVQGISSFGKVGPIKKREDTPKENVERTMSTDFKPGFVQSPESSGKDRVMHGAASYGDKGNNTKGEKSVGKGDPFSFVPRILRKPKMDDPEVNQPLLSSNQMKWDKSSVREGEDAKFSLKGRNDQISRGAQMHDAGDRKQGEDMSDMDALKRRDGKEIEGEESKKPRVNRWDQHGKTEEKRPESESNASISAIAKLSGLEQSTGETSKRQLDEEMEREIERRVQERLRQQESNRKESDAGDDDKDRRQDKKNDRRRQRSSSDDDSDDSRRRGSSRRSDRKDRERRHSKNRSDNSEDDESRYRERGEPWRGRGGRGRRGRGGWRGRGGRRGGRGGRGRRVEVVEQRKGWCEDGFGNTYFAQYGKPLYVGKNFDVYGNYFLVQIPSSKQQSEREATSRRYSPRSRRHGRSRSRSSSSRSSGSPRRKRSKSTEKSRQKDDGDEDKTTRKDIESKIGQASLLEPHHNRKNQNSGLAAQSPRVTTSGVSERSGENIDEKAGDLDRPCSAGRSDLEQFARSRWDTDNQSMGDDVPRGKDSKRDSLTELEKFLLELKQQKKKQWIAEGKIKDN